MRKLNFIYVLLIIALFSCVSKTDKRHTDKGVNPDSIFIKSAKSDIHVVTLTKTKLVLFDGKGITNNFLPYNSFREFIEQENWNSSTDTIINDERGVFIGHRAYNQGSFIRWLDDSTIVELHAQEPQNFKIKFDLRCGLTSQDKLLSIFFASPPDRLLKLDSLRIDFGYLDNDIDISLEDKKIRTIDFRSYPD